jgi:uncharacterized protein with NRDE domain
MCLILIAHQMTEQVPLLVLANRDEFYNRPTAAAERWDDCPELVAGRDLVSGGTWFGACGSRWASVTNIREGIRDKEHHSSKSRGWLVRDYLMNGMAPVDFLASIKPEEGEFAGYNLLLGDGEELWSSSNREDQAKSLAPGVYGLSNHLLDTPWPKVLRGKESFKRLLEKIDFSHEEAFALLADTTRATDADLPDTGIPLEWERALSAIFITMPEYGTRCSTLLQVDADGRRFFTERRFTGGPQRWEESRFSWSADGSLLDR